MTAADILSFWPVAASAAGGGGFGVAFGKWLDFRKGMRKATDEVAMSLVETLQKRVEALEADGRHERAMCDANLKILRHRLNNSDANFDAMLMMVELAPQKVLEIVALIKERREAQRVAEAHEKATISAALVAATAPSVPGATSTPAEAESQAI